MKYLIFVLFFFSVNFLIITIFLFIYKIKRKQFLLEKKDLSKNLDIIKNIIKETSNYLTKLSNIFTQNKFYDSVEEKIIFLNLQSKISREKFFIYQSLFALVGLVFSIIFIKDILIVLSITILSFFLPYFIINTKMKNKKEMIIKKIPDVLDIIIANIEGGVSLNQSIINTIKVSDNIFINELKIVINEIKLGKNLEEALIDLKERLKIKEVNNFVDAIIQSEKVGGNIKDILYSQAEIIRNGYFQYLRKKAYEAPVKLLIPLILFIFPVVFIILFGPILINFFNNGF